MTARAVAWSPGAAGPLLGDDSPDLSWQDAALCVQEDPEAWFPGKGVRPRKAKAICRRCPVRTECLEFAVSNGIAFGVWGGLSERERRHLGTQHLDSAPGPRLCVKRLHPLTRENVTPDGRCRECRNASRRVTEDRKGASRVTWEDGRLAHLAEAGGHHQRPLKAEPAGPGSRPRLFRTGGSKWEQSVTSPR